MLGGQKTPVRGLESAATYEPQWRQIFMQLDLDLPYKNHNTYVIIDQIDP